MTPATILLGYVAIAVRRFATTVETLTRLLKLPTSEPFAKHGPLVLCDGCLNLQQELVVWIIRDGVMEKDNLAMLATKLLQKDYLVSILARQPIRAEHYNQIESAFGSPIPQAVQTGAIQTRTAVAVILEGMSW